MKLIGGLIVGLIVGLSIHFAQAAPIATNSFGLDCGQYDSPELYLMCEQAKAAKDLAETLKRIEKKLPNFADYR